MKTHSALVVDDSQDARHVLKLMLRPFSEIQVIGEAANIKEAEQLILDLDPDLVFLDIEMPGGNGFELISQLHEKGVELNVIFVTAHRDFMIDAIRANAFDYLLKPIDQEQLRKAIQRFRFRQKQNSLARISHLLEMYHHPTRIKINTRSGFLLVDTTDVLYLQADGTYTDLFLRSGQRLASSINLGRLIEKLPRHDFLRISRGICINLRYLTQVNRLKSICILNNGGSNHELTISRQYLRRIEALLEPYILKA